MGLSLRGTSINIYLKQLKRVALRSSRPWQLTQSYIAGWQLRSAALCTFKSSVKKSRSRVITPEDEHCFTVSMTYRDRISVAAKSCNVSETWPGSRSDRRAVDSMARGAKDSYSIVNKTSTIHRICRPKAEEVHHACWLPELQQRVHDT